MKSIILDRQQIKNNLIHFHKHNEEKNRSNPF